MFFPRIFNILRPLPCKDRAAIGCTENGQPIRVTVNSDLKSDELISYMQGMDCSKFGKNTVFNEHPVRTYIDLCIKMSKLSHKIVLYSHIRSLSEGLLHPGESSPYSSRRRNMPAKPNDIQPYRQECITTKAKTSFEYQP